MAEIITISKEQVLEEIKRSFESPGEMPVMFITAKQNFQNWSINHLQFLHTSNKDMIVILKTIINQIEAENLELEN